MHKNGSLRDYLNNNKKIFNHFLKKYSNGTPNALNVDDIRLYGKQILLLLEFMQQKSIIFGKYWFFKINLTLKKFMGIY